MVHSSFLFKAFATLQAITSLASASPIAWANVNAGTAENPKGLPIAGQQNPFTLSSSSTFNDYMKQNSDWKSNMEKAHPSLFKINAEGQAPHTLWIGCADSRISESALKIVPGEAFGLRSIANIVNTNDVLAMATLEYGVLHLGVKKLVVVGHTSCGGVEATLKNTNLGPELSHVTQHLQPLSKVMNANAAQIKSLATFEEQSVKLSKLNVLAQMETLKSLDFVKTAMSGSGLQVWGLLYHVDTGLLESVTAK